MFLHKIGVRTLAQRRNTRSILVHTPGAHISKASSTSLSSHHASNWYLFRMPGRIARCEDTATFASPQASWACRPPTLTSLEFATTGEGGDCMQPGSGRDWRLNKAPMHRLRRARLAAGGLFVGGFCTERLAHLLHVHDRSATRISVALVPHCPITLRFLDLDRCPSAPAPASFVGVVWVLRRCFEDTSRQTFFCRRCFEDTGRKKIIYINT